MNDCIFCKILNKEIPSQIIFENEVCFAINDINPKAKKHILVIPKKHVQSLNEIEDFTLVKQLFEAIREINNQNNINHFKTVINTGSRAGQEVAHLHIHILAD